MHWVTVLGLSLQLVGSYFLCRVFFRVNSLARSYSREWGPRLTDSAWNRFWGRVGKYLFWAPKLYVDPGGKADEIIANPNATFAFILILAGALCQIAAAV
ncbi:MAG: hypothetical protein ACRD98_00930 [Nitrososphaera sp.]